MVELEIFGSWATALDTARLGGFVFPHYLVLGRCSTGCHALLLLVDRDTIPEGWDEYEAEVREAFARKHPAPVL